MMTDNINWLTPTELEERHNAKWRKEAVAYLLKACSAESDSYNLEDLIWATCYQMDGNALSQLAPHIKELRVILKDAQKLVVAMTDLIDECEGFTAGK